MALRQIDWPETREVVQQPLEKATTLEKAPISQSGKAVGASEAALCNTDGGYSPDIRVYNELHVRSSDWRAILANLYWRSARQAAVWDTYQLLLQHRFVDKKCLTVLMDLMVPSPDAGVVIHLLSCFLSIFEDSNRIFAGKIPMQTSEWLTDIEWLATVIVWSGKDLPDLFTTISSSKILGECVEEEFQLFKEMNPNAGISQNAPDGEGDAEVVNSQVNPKDAKFGLWLPRGLSSDKAEFNTQIETCLKRAKIVEDAFAQLEFVPSGLLRLDFKRPVDAEDVPGDQERFASPATGDSLTQATGKLNIAEAMELSGRGDSHKKGPSEKGPDRDED